MPGYTIHAAWDSDACVWVAESEDIPGLATEAPTMELLMTKLKDMVPELLVLNGKHPSGKIPVHVIGERTDYLAIG
jgi:predicted RNase H-like HicB family nuclease